MSSPELLKMAPPLAPDCTQQVVWIMTAGLDTWDTTPRVTVGRLFSSSEKSGNPAAITGSPVDFIKEDINKHVIAIIPQARVAISIQAIPRGRVCVKIK